MIRKVYSSVRFYKVTTTREHEIEYYQHFRGPFPSITSPSSLLAEQPLSDFCQHRPVCLFFSIT